MSNKYIPQSFEKKWTDYWLKNETYKAGAKTGKKKMYVLDMFPYPSGAGLHVGHPRGFVASDILARYYRMRDYDVLHPMGWDAFGLPAENAAIKAKRNPKEIVAENIANFKRQLLMLGLSYDWSREFSTTDPNYYKWTQWLFIQFFKMGLLYKKSTPVYYCPHCKTGLAQEEVLPNGTHERCGTTITIKELPQWIFRITTYAERLLQELEGLNWPSGILEMQKHWIGKSEGSEIVFSLENYDDKIKVFTTRPDTLYGATAVVLAPEHEVTEEIISGEIKVDAEIKAKITDYVKQAKNKMDLQRTDLAKEKTGVPTSLHVRHPLTGEKVPVWIADYVLGQYGHGAVMSVPAHDERDREFAKKYNLSIKQVVRPLHDQVSSHEEAYTGEGILVNSGDFDGLTTEEGKIAITRALQKMSAGQKIVQYKIRDWIFSRQRYWGEPIPMVFCQKCERNKVSYWDTEDGKAFQKAHQKVSKADKRLQESLYGWFPSDEKNLPLELPYLKSYEPTETAESPLSRVKEWVAAKCPNCGGSAKRETDTMPNWAGSCWYFLRFADPHDNHQAWGEEAAKRWLPVDLYIGGAEHAVLHLLYSRFWVKALQDLGLVHFSEPFIGLRNQGMILAADHRKMSKSFGNVINPDDVVSEYGADALRTYEMFMAPFSQEIPWSTSAFQGSYRFLKRIWDLFHSGGVQMGKDQMRSGDKELVNKLRKTILKVSRDIEEFKFNTAVSSMMEFVNAWEAGKDGLSVENAKEFLKLLAPFAPFTSEEIWQSVLEEKKSIHTSFWPQIDPTSIKEEKIVIPVQIDGKVRGTIVLTESDTESMVVDKSLQDAKMRAYLEGKNYKVIYVAGKILSFVTKK